MLPSAKLTSKCCSSGNPKAEIFWTCRKKLAEIQKKGADFIETSWYQHQK